uniref:PiggyBac transposable element-derived protein domain-containing protein n=1 Tax=Vespula pensylvanica TaxID=30213 RepID=A0A834N0D1_VESPE|nr:hypothetical protein H0235_017496 [Vespula pensylvanica]
MNVERKITSIIKNSSYLSDEDDDEIVQKLATGTGNSIRIIGNRELDINYDVKDKGIYNNVTRKGNYKKKKKSNISLVRHVNRDFKLFYIPHKELSIDESLVGTLCHSSIIQYLPDKKHHRWNITF